METTRQQKIARLLQKDLGELFRTLSRDQFQGTLVTVTKVSVSPDLSVAKVYLSIWGKSDKQQVLDTIKANTKEIRLRLGNRVHNQIRIIPELMFFIFFFQAEDGIRDISV